jgi:activating signal cointegrator 1
LSVLQPWASLVAIGAKRYETRSWRTDYRGPIAIHASKKLDRQARDFCSNAIVAAAYRRAGVTDPSKQLPRGAVVATAQLVAVYRTEDLRAHLSEEELTFGFYGNGRFAWELFDVVALSSPIPATASLNLWEWAKIPSMDRR